MTYNVFGGTLNLVISVYLLWTRQPHFSNVKKQTDSCQSRDGL